MRFIEVTLYSSQLQAQKEFYTQTLELPLIAQTADSFTVQAGYTFLQFCAGNPKGPYHFAFNIPSNKGIEALSWVQARLENLAFEGADLVDFTAWNAEALYFYDTEGNILEFIARKNLQDNRVAPFDTNQILGVSELGCPCLDVGANFEYLHQHFQIPQYSGDQHRFCAVGGEEALFIIIQQDQKRWIPNDDLALPIPFEVSLSLAKPPNTTVRLRYQDGSFGRLK